MYLLFLILLLGVNFAISWSKPRQSAVTGPSRSKLEALFAPKSFVATFRQYLALRWSIATS